MPALGGPGCVPGPGQAASPKGYTSFLATCRLWPGLEMCRLVSEGFPTRALTSSVGSPDEEWVVQGSRDTSASYIVLISWNLPLLHPPVWSSCLSMVCILGRGRLPEDSQHEGEAPPAPLQMLHRQGKQSSTQLVHQRPKGMMGRRRPLDFRPAQALLGQVNRRLLREGPPSGLRF